MEAERHRLFHGVGSWRRGVGDSSVPGIGRVAYGIVSDFPPPRRSIIPRLGAGGPHRRQHPRGRRPLGWRPQIHRGGCRQGCLLGRRRSVVLLAPAFVPLFVCGSRMQRKLAQVVVDGESPFKLTLVFLWYTLCLPKSRSLCLRCASVHLIFVKEEREEGEKEEREVYLFAGRICDLV
ncbi:hypothetical protein EJB05_49175 [Eragrostis curvula]|uniref:Uncharacterized protein n=1 Tax=Eragrostis curvula TaxID=38414 RepID=A0A5J9T4T6_9POAL|nr:hypothetical protein EJB05_49175 [Eragrostis curvula]